jgi:large subunit ribosomal protein L21
MGGKLTAGPQSCDNSKLSAAQGRCKAAMQSKPRGGQIRRTSVSSGSGQMFAVIRTGGKQYRVSAGDRLKVESLPIEVGQQVKLAEVLAVGEGSQVRVGAAVTATVLAHGRHDKVKIFKMRRRKHFQKHGGHRQNFTELRIDSIA